MLIWLKNLSAKRRRSRQKSQIIVNKPVFVIGCARSGTTLLFQLLRRHPDLAPTTGYPDGEDHVGWVEHGKCLISGLGYRDIDHGQTGGNYCLHMDENDVNEDIIHSMHDYYYQDVLSQDISKRVINKCPHISNKLRYVQRIFPDAKFIHIIRDCLPVVASWKKMLRDEPNLSVYWPDSPYPCFWVSPETNSLDREHKYRHEPRIFPGGDIKHLVDYWRLVNRNIPIQVSENKEQLLTIRYEDLCESPAEKLAEILRFCDLQDIELPIKDDYGRVPDSANAKYNQILSKEEISIINECSNDVRIEFGY